MKRKEKNGSGSDFTGGEKYWTTTLASTKGLAAKSKENRAQGIRQYEPSAHRFATFIAGKELSQTPVHRKSRSVLLTVHSLQLG